jgi:hypothetical protein
MAGKYADGVYSRHPWTAPAEAAYPPQEYIGPFQSNQERMISQAIAVGTMTSEEIQEYVRPNLPQIQLFPEKFGYPTTEVGIEDIVELRGRPAAQRVESDFSQKPNSQQSSSRNTLGDSI